MSGGSFDYLCHKAPDDLLVGHHEQLESMADALAARGAVDAARETNAILADIRAFSARMDARLARMADVWKAVEWHYSSDWGEERIEQALKAYREGREPPRQDPATSQSGQGGPRLEVTKRVRFSAAHHLPNHDGDCARNHGHNFWVEITVAGEQAGEGPHEGMVFEFGRIKQAWKQIEPSLDHQDLNETIPARFQPATTENIALFLLDYFRRAEIPATRIRVEETPDNWATASIG